MILDTFPEGEIVTLLKKYGEEPRSRSIAKRIVATRPISSTIQLSKLVEEALADRKGGRIHPATRTFQALRIAVNRELERLNLKEVES